MKYVTPSYMNRFRCKADKCKDCCCIGWEIDIDSKTSEYYSSVKGEFGKRLYENISHSDTVSFILDEKERCPFLSHSGLCDIITELGNDSLCQICRDHPRYFEWYDSLKEGGIGLCCEEAAEIIINSDGCSFVTSETEDEGVDEYNTDLFEFMFRSREKMMELVKRSDISVHDKISSLLDFSEELQQRADNGDFQIPEITVTGSESQSDMTAVFSYLDRLEHIDKNWPDTLHILTESAAGIRSLHQEAAYKKQKEYYLSNILNYFIWRHFLKGVFDEEFLSRIKFACISTAVISFMFDSLTLKDLFSSENCACAAKDYSKEIEYCDENLESILNDSYELDIFSSEYIKGMI